MSPVAHSQQAHRFSTKKKKKLQRIRKSNPSHRCREIKSVAEKSNPNTAYTEQISKSKSNSTANQTQTQSDRGVYLKKKKIPNTQTKTKPQQTKPSNPRSCCRDTAARSLSSSSLAPHRRSQIGDHRS